MHHRDNANFGARVDGLALVVSTIGKGDHLEAPISACAAVVASGGPERGLRRDSSLHAIQTDVELIQL